MNDVHTHIVFQFPLQIVHTVHPYVRPCIESIHPSIRPHSLIIMILCTNVLVFIYERTLLKCIYFYVNYTHTFFTFRFHFSYIYIIYMIRLYENVHIYMQHMNSKCKQYFLVLNRNLYD